MKLIELHLHLEGSIYPSDALYLAKKNNLSFSLLNYKFDSFNGFLKSFGKIASLLREKEDFAYILSRHLKRLERMGVIYCEIRISPSVWQYWGLNVEEIFNFLVSYEPDSKVKYYFIVEAVRQWDKSLLERDFLLSLSAKGKVKAFGLGGDETIAPIENFSFLFEECYKNGLTFIPHSGESSSEKEVLNSIEMGAKRIGHGVMAYKDLNVMNKLKDRKVHLEICITSNVKNKLFESYDKHPLKIFYKEGIDFSISTDDPGIFLTTMKKEIFYLKRILKVDEDKVREIQKRALLSSLLNEEEKNHFLMKYF